MDLEKYREIFGKEYDAQKHLSQPDSFIVDHLPHYSPKHDEDHISILGFNKIPLPYSPLQEIIDHPELVPDDALIRWTIEQEL